MAKLFPFKPEREHDTAGPRLVNLEDDGAEDVFAALSADTARNILSRLYESPATASDVAEAADTSLQNARYHLEKLEAAGLIEVVDTWYSSRGTEMAVYGPTNEPLVVAAGDDESEGVLKRALERVVGAVFLLAVGSVFIDRLLRRFPSFGYASTGPGEQPNVNAPGPRDLQDGTPTSAPIVDAPSETPTNAPAPTPADGGVDATTPMADLSPTDWVNGTVTPSPTADTPSVTDSATAGADPQLIADGGEVIGSIPPGASFFVGGLTVLALASAWWYFRQYRPLYG